MTAQMFAETNAPFDLLSSFSGKFRRSGSSTMNVDVIADPIRRLFTAWEQFATTPQVSGRADGRGLTSPISRVVPSVVAPVAVAVPEVRRFPLTPVEAVDYLVALLQVSRDAVLRGTNVSQSSYYRWKRDVHTEPRPDSLGRLWPAVRALSQLESVHPNLASWYHSTPEAQEAFEAGRLNRLIQLEFEWLNSNAPHLGGRSMTSASVPAPWFGDVADIELTMETDDTAGVSQAPPFTSQSSRLARSRRPRQA